MLLVENLRVRQISVEVSFQEERKAKVFGFAGHFRPKNHVNLDPKRHVAASSSRITYWIARMNDAVS